MANENVPVDGDRYWNDSVQIDEEGLAHLGEHTEGNIVPYLLGIGQKNAQQHPDVGDTVEEDHAVDQGRVLPVPDPVHDVRVDREADKVGHSDAQDVEQVPLLFRQKNHVGCSDFNSRVVPGESSRQVLIHCRLRRRQWSRMGAKSETQPPGSESRG